MKSSYLGPEFNNQEIKEALKYFGVKYHKLSEEDLFEKTADAITKGKAIDWM